MRTALRIFLLAAAFALATAGFGWWAVPAVAGGWGLIAPGRAGRSTAFAAALGWAGLLALQAWGGGLLRLAPLVAGAMQLPTPVPLLLTLALPAVLAWATATLAAEIGVRLHPPGVTANRGVGSRTGLQADT